MRDYKNRKLTSVELAHLTAGARPLDHRECSPIPHHVCMVSECSGDGKDFWYLHLRIDGGLEAWFRFQGSSSYWLYVFSFTFFVKYGTLSPRLKEAFL